MTESSGDWEARDSIVMHGSYNQLSHLFAGHLCSKKKTKTSRDGVAILYSQNKNYARIYELRYEGYVTEA